MNIKELYDLEKKWKKGAQITNSKLTKEMRQRAAKEGWEKRKKRLSEKL